MRDSCLRLFIPPEQGLWCPDDHQPPTYPMQAMLTLYDFPEWSGPADANHVPELVIDFVRAT